MPRLLTVLAPLAVAAAVKYLRDPDPGRQRRARWRREAGDAVHEAGDALERAGRQAADRLQDLAHEGRKAGRRALHRAEALARESHGRRALRHGQPPEPEHSGRGGALTGVVGGLAVGAAAVYMLDPQQGRQRLAWARDRAVRYAASAGLGPRAEALAAQLGRLLGGAAPDDATLAARVRAVLERTVSQPQAIEVSVAAGCVTLGGPVLASEQARLLEAVQAVRGVRRIDIRLQLQGPGEALPSLPHAPQGEAMPAPRVSGPRPLALAGGAALALYGLRRRGWVGLLAGAAGLGLALRAGRDRGPR
ncbi:BON domain-containing protein [Azohydromonas caseinilytica]|uniref:BON domain-containing protein n=1 Tax=Azohydromonas caseinilytica TaxID=2728836 RepID=A0A848FG67_9BURK|nr:BON domain-containing protein [Azohydromonas caseinilytica]NML17130.1 BON domain-containing protein [Azohydromonas caseinilytica]